MYSVNRSSMPVSVAVFLLRLVWGGLFLVHGIIKFTDIDKAINAFARVGIVLPTFTAPAIGLLEVIGGVILILGFSWVTRLLALLLAADMTVAIVKVKYSAGLIKGYELELLLLTGLLAIALIGPGLLALFRERTTAARRVVPTSS